MRVAGKMSSVERQLNKDDLLAYKHFDGNQYALVPGVTSKAQRLDRQKLAGTTPGSPSQPPPVIDPSSLPQYPPMQSRQRP
jgi:hypothetical protein